MARRTDLKTHHVDLKNVKARDALRPRASKEPYWQSLSSGCYLGFRPSTRKDGHGVWIARFNDPDTGKKPSKSMGDFGTLAPSARFGAAKTEAEEWFRHLSHGGSEDDVTVGEACKMYAGDVDEIRRRFNQYVYSDPIAKIKLRKLREHHVTDWRKRLESLPALVTRTKNRNAKVVTRKRAPATVNRDIVPLRAALYAAMRRGEVSTALAWQTALRPIEAEGRRETYLDIGQRRKLLEHMSEDARAFFRGLSQLPLRPGTLAKFRVADYEARTSSLVVDSDKAHGGRRLLLPNETGVFFKMQAKDKLPNAPLFMRADGKAWNKDSWKHPIKEAAAAAGLPRTVTAYTLRHSTITDLVVDGLDLLTVAKISGTSVRMIEKHYGHLKGKHAAAALAKLVL